MNVVEMFGVWQLSKSGQAKPERKLCMRSVCQRAKQLDIATVSVQEDGGCK